MIRLVDSGDHVSHGSDASIDDLLPFTIVMWFRPDTGIEERQFWHKQSGSLGRSGYGAGASWLGIGGYTSRVTGYDARETTEFMSVGTAYFLCWTYSTTNRWRLWYGTESAAVVECSYSVTDQSGSGAPDTDAANALIIGWNPAGGNVVRGDIGRVGYFSAELSQANLETLRTSPPSTWESLFASCELASDYTDTSTLTDVTSNSNDGTNSGGSTASDPSYPVLQYILAWLRA